MLGRIAVFAAALVAANAVQLGKCRSKSEPVFVDGQGHIEEPLVGGDPATWGPAEADAETAIGAAIGALAKGEEMTQGEAEAAFGGEANCVKSPSLFGLRRTKILIVCLCYAAGGNLCLKIHVNQL